DFGAAAHRGGGDGAWLSAPWLRRGGAGCRLRGRGSGMSRVTIFDTTLRDGEQAPGASMNLQQKMTVAVALRDFGVDVIELGFPTASPGDFEAVETISRSVEGPVMCALARANRQDIDAATQALKDAPRRRLHVFLATSPIHREFKLKLGKHEIVRTAS